MTKEISRNPSFTPSPRLRDYLNNSDQGTTASINALFDRYQMIIDLDAIRLTPEGQFALKEYFLGVWMDDIAIQSLPQDVIETHNKELIEKFSGATFGQTVATFSRYGLI